MVCYRYQFYQCPSHKTVDGSPCKRAVVVLFLFPPWSGVSSNSIRMGLKVYNVYEYILCHLPLEDFAIQITLLIQINAMFVYIIICIVFQNFVVGLEFVSWLESNRFLLIFNILFQTVEYLFYLKLIILIKNNSFSFITFFMIFICLLLI